MKSFVYSWLISLSLILALDSIWFSLTVQRFYKPYLGHIISGDFKYTIAFVFYLLYSFGIIYLVINPSLLLNENVFSVWRKGLVLGLVSYAAYDLTNHATIKNWPTIVTIIDILWGAVLTGTAAAITYKIVSAK